MNTALDSTLYEVIEDITCNFCNNPVIELYRNPNNNFYCIRCNCTYPHGPVTQINKNKNEAKEMKRKSYKNITQLEETEEYLKALELSWSVWNWRGKNVEKDIEEWEWYTKYKENLKNCDCPVCTLRAKTGVHYVCRSSLEMKDCSFVELCRACVHMWQHGTPELQKSLLKLQLIKFMMKY